MGESVIVNIKKLAVTLLFSVLSIMGEVNGRTTVTMAYNLPVVLFVCLILCV